MKVTVKTSSRLRQRVTFFLPEVVIVYHHEFKKSILAGNN
jgi:hypothetical protein